MARPSLFNLLEAEMRLERASALARVGEKIQKALDEAGLLAARLQKEPPGADREMLLTRYREARSRAEENRYYLIVQREALGLLDHQIVDEIYPMPPPLR